MSKYLTMAERGTAFADIMRMRQSHEPRMGGDDPREEAKRRRAAARAEDALRGHADEAEALLLEVARHLERACEAIEAADMKAIYEREMIAKIRTAVGRLDDFQKEE